MKMSDRQLYVRLLTDLNWRFDEKKVWQVRARLQDVLCQLRDRVADAEGITEQEAQDSAESEALEAAVKLNNRGDY